MIGLYWIVNRDVANVPLLQDLVMNANGQSHSRSQSLAGGVSGSYGRTEYLTAPKGIASGAFLITPYEALVQETRSRRFHEYLNIGDIAQEYPITKSKSTYVAPYPAEVTDLVQATLPQYIPRKSRNELKRIASGNESLLGTQGRNVYHIYDQADK